MKHYDLHPGFPIHCPYDVGKPDFNITNVGFYSKF